MTAEHNATRIRAAYDAFARGDGPALVDIFAPDVVWHYPGTSVLAGDYVGRDAVLGLLGQFAARTEGSYRADLRDVMASDDHASGWANDVGTRHGKKLDVNAVVVFQMGDGQVTEAWHYSTTRRRSMSSGRDCRVIFEPYTLRLRWGTIINSLPVGGWRALSKRSRPSWTTTTGRRWRAGGLLHQRRPWHPWD